MKTTWPKFTYPVRPVMKFREYASAAKIRRLTKIVSVNRGIHGANPPRTTRNTPMPHNVGPIARNFGIFTEGSPQGGTAGSGSQRGRRSLCQGTYPRTPARQQSARRG